MAECQRRVHDLIDLQLCSAGVEAAIKAHDYETGTYTFKVELLDALHEYQLTDPKIDVVFQFILKTFYTLK